jgi:hypothetical protein
MLLLLLLLLLLALIETVFRQHAAVPRQQHRTCC